MFTLSWRHGPALTTGAVDLVFSPSRKTYVIVFLFVSYTSITVACRPGAPRATMGRVNTGSHQQKSNSQLAASKSLLAQTLPRCRSSSSTALTLLTLTALLQPVVRAEDTSLCTVSTNSHIVDGPCSDVSFCASASAAIEGAIGEPFASGVPGSTCYTLCCAVFESRGECTQYCATYYHGADEPPPGSVGSGASKPACEHTALLHVTSARATVVAWLHCLKPGCLNLA
jgi:hypothetical protein